MEQSCNDSHPETHWKHETPLPDCDCIMWVTHKLLAVVAAANILKPQFWGVWGKPPFLGVCFFDDRTHVTYCSHLVYSNEIQEINMSSNTCHFQFVYDTHAVKYNTALNSDPQQNVSSILLELCLSEVGDKPNLSCCVTVIIDEADVPPLCPRETRTLHNVADMHS